MLIVADYVGVFNMKPCGDAMFLVARWGMVDL
jgi:hypothetical protein